MDFINMTASTALVVPSVDDVASDFIEQEVGRHDWVRNWDVVKAREDVVKMVGDWASGFAMRVDPREVVSHIDAMAKSGGAWL